MPITFKKLIMGGGAGGGISVGKLPIDFATPTPTPTETPLPTSTQPTPTATPIPTATPAPTSAPGTGALWVWGDNSNGSLGAGLDPNDFPGFQYSQTWYGGQTYKKAIKTFQGLYAEKTDGTLWFSGYNEVTYPSGNLSIPKYATVSIAQQIPGSPWNPISWDASPNGNFTFEVAIVKSDGTLWVWGDNSYGQLGKNNKTHYSSPVQVGTDTSWNKVKVTPFAMHNIKSNGTLWGCGSGGVIGNNSAVHRSSPVQIGTQSNWTQIFASNYNACILATKSDNTLWMWGASEEMPAAYSSPILIMSNKSWVDMTYDRGVMLGITSTGELWGRGLNYTGMINEDTTIVNYSSMVQIHPDKTYKKIEVYNRMACAIDTSGRRWAWGGNYYDVLAGDVFSITSSPVQVDSWGTWEDIYLSTQSNFGTGIRSDIAPTPVPTMTPSPTPSPTPAPTATPPATPSTTAAAVYSFGKGQPVLGRLTNDNNWYAPGLIVPGDNVQSVNSNNSTAAAMIRNNNLYTWGLNYRGILGTNSTVATTRSSPVIVGQTSEYWATIAMANQALATKLDGTAWAWGDNQHGQLGLGDKVHRSSPVQLGTESDYYNVNFHCNTQNSFIIKGGNLWAWGRNANGESGQNDVVARSSPVQVGTDSTWNDLSIASGSVLATKSDGTLWAWGNASNGVLGNNSLVHRSSPVQIGSDTTWFRVFAGESSGSVFATKTDGTLWGWGQNTTFALGVPTKSLLTYSSPIQIAGTGWSDVVSFAGSTLAKKSNGTLWSWGSRWLRADMVGENITISSPVQVGFASTKWTSIGRTNDTGYAIYKRTT